jgi:hypothetical protein
MKKCFSFTVPALVFMIFFACALPASVEVKGSPKVKFAANMDFNEYFVNIMGSALKIDENQDIKIIDCTNNKLDNLTKLVYRNFLRDTFDLNVELAPGLELEDFIDDLKVGDLLDLEIFGHKIPVEVLPLIPGEPEKKVFVMDRTETLFENKANPVEMPFSGLGDYLLGFEFDKVISYLYFSDSEVISALSIDFFLVDEGGVLHPLTIGNDNKDPAASGLYEILYEDKIEDYEYPEDKLPGGGRKFEISEFLNTNQDIKIAYEIYLEKDAVINLDWIGPDHLLLVEMLAWIPMHFKAVRSPGAELLIPGYFDGMIDGLKTLSGLDVIKSLSIDIEMSPRNPFAGAQLVINDEGVYKITNQLTQGYMSFGLSEKDIEFINNNEFDPKFSIFFPRGGILSIPRGEMMFTYATLNARLKYEMDL